MATAAPRPAAAPGRRWQPRALLRGVHRTLGLFAGLYLLMASLTGAALMFRGEIVALAHPELGPPPGDLVQRAERLAATLEPGSYTAIRFPDAALPAFIVHRPDHVTELFDPHSLAPVPDRFGVNRAMDWLFELHHYLLAGETGRIASGLFGIAIALLVLIGLYLWWPWRKGWRLRHARPARPTRAARLAAHTTLAALTAPTLLLAALTGAGVVFHAETRAGLIALFGTADPALVPPVPPDTLAGHGARLFPDGKPRILLPPAPDGTLTLRIKEAAELHPNGRSTLSWDRESGRVVAATSDLQSGLGNRIFNALYPLHTGAAGGLPMRLLLLAGALGAFWSGLFALRSRLSRRARSRVAGAGVSR